MDAGLLGYAAFGGRSLPIWTLLFRQAGHASSGESQTDSPTVMLQDSPAY